MSIQAYTHAHTHTHAHKLSHTHSLTQTHSHTHSLYLFLSPPLPSLPPSLSSSHSSLSSLLSPLSPPPPLTHTTHTRRVSWAPDGNSLCITGGTKSSKPVGMILLRGSWVCAADLVGHEAPSVCCRFCPYVLAPYVPGAGSSSSSGYNNQIISKGKSRDPGA